jgi:hypothetical protein
VGSPPRRPRNTPLSAKVGTKIRRPVVVAQSVKFACELKATELVRLFCLDCQLLLISPRTVLQYCNKSKNHCGQYSVSEQSACMLLSTGI